MNDYQPKPIDTTQVRLPREVEDLTELLAKNTHDNWARQRLAEGWQWGAQRNDSKKLHPSLVAYDDLPESERTYDRTTAMETLKALVELGFKISRT